MSCNRIHERTHKSIANIRTSSRTPLRQASYCLLCSGRLYIWTRALSDLPIRATSRRNKWNQQYAPYTGINQMLSTAHNVPTMVSSIMRMVKRFRHELCAIFYIYVIYIHYIDDNIIKWHSRVPSHGWHDTICWVIRERRDLAWYNAWYFAIYLYSRSATIIVRC